MTLPIPLAQARPELYVRGKGGVADSKDNKKSLGFFIHSG